MIELFLDLFSYDNLVIYLTNKKVYKFMVKDERMIHFPPMRDEFLIIFGQRIIFLELTVNNLTSNLFKYAEENKYAQQSPQLRGIGGIPSTWR